jgi:2-keto-3-deoxy-L-rhamnonate aldolase RhmA
MTQQFRKKLLSGELLIGPMVTLTSSDVAELFAEVGFDWLFVDAEHGPFSARELQNVLQGAGKDMSCVIRLPVGDEGSIKTALDVGAAGIIAPQVNTQEQAERIVRAAKYAPEGARGVGIARASRFGLNFNYHIESANQTTAVIVQAEHIEAVNNIEKIVRVPGIDAIFIGPYDLSASLGLMGQVGHPEVTGAIDRITEACREVNLKLGIFGVSAKAVRPYIEKGFTLIVAGVDTLLMGQAAAALLAELKN